MIMKTKVILFTTLASIAFTSCTVIKQGEVGVKRSFGKINEKLLKLLISFLLLQMQKQLLQMEISL